LANGIKDPHDFEYHWQKYLELNIKEHDLEMVKKVGKSREK